MSDDFHALMHAMRERILTEAELNRMVDYAFGPAPSLPVTAPGKDPPPSLDRP